MCGSIGALSPTKARVALCDSVDQISTSWDTADWLGGYRDGAGSAILPPCASIIDLTVFGSKGFQWLYRDEMNPNHDANDGH